MISASVSCRFTIVLSPFFLQQANVGEKTAANLAAVMSSSGDGRSGILRDFRNRLRYSLGFVFQCQIGLSDYADNAVFGINDGNSPYLMLLHQSFTSFDIFAITT